jgi:ATP-binding cassette, subfamily B, bacterial
MSDKATHDETDRSTHPDLYAPERFQRSLERSRRRRAAAAAARRRRKIPTTDALSEHHEANRLLLQVARQGGAWVLLLSFTALALAGITIALPWVLGQAVDAVLGQASGAWITLVAGLVVALVACDALDDLAMGGATARSTAWLRLGLLARVLALGPRADRKFEPGDLVARLVGNAAQAGRVSVDAVRGLASLLSAIGGIVALVLIDPWLGATFLSGAPLLLLLTRAFAREMSTASARYLELQGKISARLADALSGARTIATAGTTNREADRVLAPLPEMHQHGMSMWDAQTKRTSQSALLVPMLQVAVLAVAGARLAQGRITPGELLAASQYVLLATTIGSVVGTLAALARERAAAARASEVLREPAVAYGAKELPPGPGQLELCGVTVRRNGRPALDGVDLVVPGAKLVALVGPSGSGKSVLAGLVGRLTDADEGQVLLNGIPVQELEHGSLRREVSYGFERPELFGETFADAIASEEIVAAARSARADGFIRRMPKGYRTPLSESPMSGGETQRVGLARTFAQAGRIVVLDDVAASLDTVTEYHIGRVLTGALAGRTRIVVAHRASTASRADLVVWLEEGRVRAVGPHSELWRERDYRALFDPGELSEASERPTSRHGDGA